MTLLYTDTFVERQAIAPVRWQVKEFLLIHSFVGEGRQEILGRWPLR
jgi:2'-5' RNA ligase